jgi:acetylornithine/N-succinyldiaminopimelate aminotransferase
MVNVVETTNESIFQTYKRYPVVLDRGKGCLVWDDKGREYLDFLAGIAVCNLGHCHPAIVQAAKEQLDKLMHVSNYFYTKPQAELSELIIKNSFADRIFFCNSGAEANEAALKLARKYGQDHSAGKKYEIITMEYSFHGRTFATLTATGQDKFHHGFGPLLPGFKYVPFNDIKALREAVSDSTCAIMLEPIQAEGGVNMPAQGYLKSVRELCDEKGLLLIYDEVQVGLGRTGKLFAYEYAGVAPDIMTLAKAIGGGLPGGAMLAGKTVAETFTAGSHATTFGGNPVVMAAGVATMKVLLEGTVLENCRAMGAYFMEQLKMFQAKYPQFVKDIRGAGLIIGMDTTLDGRDIVSRCLDKGLIINFTRDSVLRFLPPLIVEKQHIDRCMQVLEEVFAAL